SRKQDRIAYTVLISSDISARCSVLGGLSADRNFAGDTTETAVMTTFQLRAARPIAEAGSMSSLFRRIAPAIALFFLAPLVAEFLLGDFPLSMIGILLVLAPLYGGGAILIRETTRRAGRGWPTILTLALAYGIFEEAFTTQTLFNPNYLGLNLHLLDHAFV